MNPTASPRHPLKAIAAVLAMLVVVHGARAHIDSSDHGTHIHIVHASPSDTDCPDIDVDEDDDGPDDATIIDVIDGDAEWT